MKLKQLQALLEDVEPFAKPKVALEQYVTGARRDSGLQGRPRCSRAVTPEAVCAAQARTSLR